MNHHSLQRFALVVLLATIAALLGSRSAFAHTGAVPGHDLLHGLQHPLTGLDHVLAMFAVGLWAAGRGGRALWLVPATFVVVMAIGAVLGMSGVSIPFVEPGIAISVLLLGLFIAAAVRLPLATSAAIIGLFAVLHGHAHGSEIPAIALGLTYAFGFIGSTITLLTTGISVGRISQRRSHTLLVRYAGAAIAVCGLFLCIG
jgi:urease accessory protein